MGKMKMTKKIPTTKRKSKLCDRIVVERSDHAGRYVVEKILDHDMDFDVILRWDFDGRVYRYYNHNYSQQRRAKGKSVMK